MNKLINDDCLSEMKELNDSSIYLIVTDPPYKVTSRGSAGNTVAVCCKRKLIRNDIDTYSYNLRIYENGEGMN